MADIAPLPPLPETTRYSDRPVDPGTRIGHVHLKVADLDRALGFWVGVLGFQIMQRYGRQAAFVSAGGFHHRLDLEGGRLRDHVWRPCASGPASERRPLGQ